MPQPVRKYADVAVLSGRLRVGISGDYAKSVILAGVRCECGCRRPKHIHTSRQNVGTIVRVTNGLQTVVQILQTNHM